MNTPARYDDDLTTWDDLQAEIDAASDADIDAEITTASTKELIEIARFDECPVRILVRLALHDDDEVVLRVAANRTTPAEVLRRLAQHPSQSVRRAAANNPNTPEAELTTLASEFARTVAKNPATPPALLESMVNGEPDVRASLARNPATPAHVLGILARDSDTHVVMTVAINPTTSPETLSELTTHPINAVRQVAYRNRHTPLLLKAPVLATKTFGPDVRRGLSDDDVRTLILSEHTTVKQKADALTLALDRGRNSEPPLSAEDVIAPYRDSEHAAVRQAVTRVLAGMLDS